MKFIKNNLNSLIACIVEVIVGILLLVNPISFTSGIIIAVGIVLLVSGIVEIVRYFRADAVSAAAGQHLAIGLLCVVIGLFCIFDYNWFIITFPVLTILYGVANLVAGLFKVQLTIDAIRFKRRWGWIAFSAVVTLLLAAIILLNPFSSTVALWTFTAIMLIVEAIIDLISMILAGRQKQSVEYRAYSPARADIF